MNPHQFHLCQPFHTASPYPTKHSHLDTVSTSAVMSFGFAIGDFIAVLKLASDVTNALNESRGVSADLRLLVMRLNSLERAIQNAVQTVKDWDAAYPNPSNKAPLNALAEEHNICKRLLENFHEKSRRYTESIFNGQGSKMTKEWAKIKWCIFHSDDIAQLERNLRLHILAIDMYSSELRRYIDNSLVMEKY